MAALVAVQGVTAAILMVAAFAAYGRLASDLLFLHRYMLSSFDGISEAIDNAAQLKLAAEAATVTPPNLTMMRQWRRDLEVFLEPYRNEWAVADNTSDDALRFRTDLSQGQPGLVADERAAVHDIGRSLERIDARFAAVGSEVQIAASVEDDARDLRTALRKLLRTKVAFTELENGAIEARSRRTDWWMSAVGLAGLLGSLALGFHVHHAIAPRIRRLVQQVRRFKELGVHERVLEEGRDEIAVLANALDAGFSSIAARDRERDHFLAIVAHELKTPMTSILGFTELALARPDSGQVRARALDLVRSHAGRLGRLIDDLLLAASTRSGALPFHPQSVDPAVLTQKVASEVAVTMPERRFKVDVTRSRRLLADEHLLTQAVWALLSYAGAVADVGRSLIGVRLEPAGERLRLEVEFDAPAVRAEEMERAFAPFASVQYEGGSGIRSAVGLFLCREIARIHGGSLRAMNPTDVQRMLVLDLPA